MGADVELDAMKDAADAQIVAAHNALGRFVPLVAAFCRSRYPCASSRSLGLGGLGLLRSDLLHESLQDDR